MNTSTTQLAAEQFLQVIDHTPLVAIDLVVRDAHGRVLLGRRRNEPARGYWFVPGGRICKGETLDEAFLRISAAELGTAVPRTHARSLGAFTHLYDTNFMGVPGITTHYVVLAYELLLQLAPDSLPTDQHDALHWWEPEQARADETVHRHVLPYLTAAI